MIRIIVLGDLNLDIHARLPHVLPPGDEVRDAITVRPGGSAGTFARTASQCGASVIFLGAVGQDLVGDLLENSLIRANVIPRLRRTNLASGAVLAIEKDGDRSMVCARGANDGLTEDWVDETLPRDGTHLHVSGYALLSDAQRQAALHAFALAACQGMSLSLDPPPASLLQAFGAKRYLGLLPPELWLFPNRSEGRLLSGMNRDEAVVGSLSGRFPVGACTLGADGAYAWDPTTRHLQTTASLPPVDTTGAGDVYAATFITDYLQYGDLSQANIKACAAAFAMLERRLSPDA
ncbi:carbohydrate kinase family protein [Candidatus Bipolaricaulota bacterium]|nr:carbohydrate kinase family protein [Candidatus Bipolaricaulota bacterium]